MLPVQVVDRLPSGPLFHIVATRGWAWHRATVCCPGFPSVSSRGCQPWVSLWSFVQGRVLSSPPHRQLCPGLGYPRGAAHQSMPTCRMAACSQAPGSFPLGHCAKSWTWAEVGKVGGAGRGPTHLILVQCVSVSRWAAGSGTLGWKHSCKKRLCCPPSGRPWPCRETEAPQPSREPWAFQEGSAV